ncbi:hypothetical protein Sango_1683900 [Sesamum angolense]|uniref:Uncharacterized protein n=1 Tax=Sesamum angolense TaxID=2727404 RepID=A0AAE1WL47_9LAMI|nr:hypothetical protein Sango_1683900 [Sesamum angolense]
MATTIHSFRTPIVSSAASPNPRNRRSPPAAALSNSWWTPIFGWSSEPDYIGGGVKIEAADNGSAGAEKNLFRGCFTEEKAKELRKKTVETSTFHDIMYHSAIASRLASDVSGR